MSTDAARSALSSTVDENPYFDSVRALKPCPEGEHRWREVYYGWECEKCIAFYALGHAPWEEDPDDDFDNLEDFGDDEEGDFPFDCAMDRQGWCGKAGSEECDFECPYNPHS